MDAAAAGELAPGVWETRPPRRPPGPPAAFAFPLPGVGVMGFSTAAPLEPDATLLATMDSLGSQISQFVERCRAQAACATATRARARSSTPPSTASSRWTTTATWSRSTAPTERTFGYRAEEMIGRELAELIVPPGWRDAHRAGLERYVRTGRAAVGGHPLEAQGMRADGSEFPVELIVTRADLPGPPLFCGYLRDVTEARERERDLRRLADRAGRAAARGDRGRAEHRPAARVRGRDRGGRAAARRAELEHDPLRRRAARDGRSAPGTRATCATSRSATRSGWTATPASARVFRTRRAGARRQLRRTSRASSPRGCARSGSRPRSPRRSSSTAGCGAR